MTRGSTILRNVFSNWGGFAVNVLIAMALSPYIVHTLGETVYGLWILIGSLTGYLGILDLGVRTSIVKYIAEYHAQRDDDALNELFNTGLAVFMAIAAAATILALSLPFVLPLFVTSYPLPATSVHLAVIIVGLDIAISFPLGLYGGMLSGLQRYDLSNFIDIASTLARAVATVALLKMGHGIVALAAISLGSTIFASILRIRIVHRACPQLRIGLRAANRSALKKISTYGIYSFLVIIASRIIFYTDSMVITAFMSTAMVAYFAVAANMVEYVRRLIKSMTNVFVPAISSLRATGQNEKIGAMLFAGTRYTLLLTLLLGVTITAYRKEFFGLWMGAEFGVRSSAIFAVLMLPQILALAMYNFGAVLYGLAKHRALAIASVVEAAINLVLSIALVRKYGLLGVALGTAIPQVLNYLFWLPWYTCRLLEISLFEFFKRALAPPLLAAVPFAAVIQLMKSQAMATSWPSLAGHFMLCGVVFLIASWLIFLRRDLNGYVASGRFPILGRLGFGTKS